jgi:tetratricopeptide (TPR) repeat protein
MYIFAQAVLLAWPLFVIMIFNMLPPRKAVVYSFVFAWLFLPNISFDLPGVPDYTKMTATVVSVLICSLIFDQARFLAIRPTWFDIPILCWCSGTFISAIVNGLSAYDGLALTNDELVTWGLPYLVGRIYLSDVDGLKELAEAIMVGAFCYIPLCLLEIRLSPILNKMVYGIYRWEGIRYGGFRPTVFLATGLMTAMWMANACVLGYVLWSFGTLKAIRGVSFGKLTLALVVTNVLGKSTGAIFLMFFTIGVLWAVKRFKLTLLIWVLIAIPPLYCATRSLNLWSGREIVNIAKATVGEDRAQSFEYRLDMERLLVDRAMERRIFGWSGFNRFQVKDKEGNTVTVPDGFWVIAVGVQGLVGLSSIIAMFLLPMVLTLRRFPIATWSDPRVGPVVGLSMVLLMTMIDLLSNAMLMPFYPLTIGGLLGHIAYRPVAGHVEAEEALAFASELAGQGRMVEAGQEFHRAIDLASGGGDLASREVLARALDGLGHTLLADGRYEGATSAFREALVIRDGLAAESPDEGCFRDLAIARDGLSRALADSGRIAEAIEERRIALQIWEILEANHPRVVEYRDRRANTLNDLAWLLATDPSPSPQDPARAVALAEESLRISPDHDASWNTLGVSRYRAGDWAGAIEALERSAASSPGGVGTAFDHYFLAMAWLQLQRVDQAEEWLERGIAWAARNRAGHPALARFRMEAESLLQGKTSGDVP